MHTPVLRDYFLSDSHKCFFDTMQSQCVVCELGDLFQQVFILKEGVALYKKYRLFVKEFENEMEWRLI